MAKYGKDKAPRSSEGYIGEALRDGSGPSEGIHTKSIGRGQTINTAFPMDNVELAMDIETSLTDEGGFGGGINNLSHSLTGTSAVNTKTY